MKKRGTYLYRSDLIVPLEPKNKELTPEDLESKLTPSF